MRLIPDVKGYGEKAYYPTANNIACSSIQGVDSGAPALVSIPVQEDSVYVQTRNRQTTRQTSRLQ
jgi:hypothetical protein